ncbi:MAG: glyoxalase [Bacteroidia bacterium]|nr:glyoxalase [Bacteroidia bacterium]
MCHSKIIPTMRYINAAETIDWLCDVFGFEKHLIVPGDNGRIEHAQLKFSNGMIMCGSPNERPFGKVLRTPAELDGLTTQSVYIVIDNVKEHYDVAVSKGAEIFLPFKKEDYGGEGYTAQDPEGHYWTFGSYDPYQEDAS